MRRVTCKAFDMEFKCGGCNWETMTAWYFEGDEEPEVDEDGHGGLCASCFCEGLLGRNVDTGEG